MSKEIKITISGPQGIGKTIIAGKLMNLFKKYECLIISESDLDFQDWEMKLLLHGKKIIIETTNEEIKNSK